MLTTRGLPQACFVGSNVTVGYVLVQKGGWNEVAADFDRVSGVQIQTQAGGAWSEWSGEFIGIDSFSFELAPPVGAPPRFFFLLPLVLTQTAPPQLVAQCVRVRPTVCASLAPP